MGIGFALLIAFILGAASMFLVSEHYYRRIEKILQLPKRPAAPPTLRGESIPMMDPIQGEAFRRGERVTTRVERRP